MQMLMCECLRVCCQCVLQCWTPTGLGLDSASVLCSRLWFGLGLGGLEYWVHQFILRGLDCLSQNLKQSICMSLRYFSQNQSGAEISWQSDRVILLTWLKIHWLSVSVICCFASDVLDIDWIYLGFRLLKTSLCVLCSSYPPDFLIFYIRSVDHGRKLWIH